MAPVFDEHQLAVLDAATARLIPGPSDDPADPTPGAREAGAVAYIVGLLGALDHDPPRIYAGGPLRDDMPSFLPLSPPVRAAWEARLGDLLVAYRAGLRRLDELAEGSFPAAPAPAQDAALAANPAVPGLPDGFGGFTDLLFQHTIEACYAVPAYGGNVGGAMWTEIAFPGDAQPRGYSPTQVTEPDGPDPCDVTPIVADLLTLVASAAPPPDPPDPADPADPANRP
jgi:hypothetical protein